jgi:hypothetical protein
MDSAGDFSETVDGANQLTVFETPSLLRVRVPALPIDTLSLVETIGTDYPEGYEYECVFSKKFATRKYRTPATWVSSESVTCNLPDLGLD